MSRVLGCNGWRCTFQVLCEFQRSLIASTALSGWMIRHATTSVPPRLSHGSRPEKIACVGVVTFSRSKTRFNSTLSRAANTWRRLSTGLDWSAWFGFGQMVSRNTIYELWHVQNHIFLYKFIFLTLHVLLTLQYHAINVRTYLTCNISKAICPNIFYLTMP